MEESVQSDEGEVKLHPNGDDGVNSSNGDVAVVVGYLVDRHR